MVNHSLKNSTGNLIDDFPKREIPKAQEINFVVGTKTDGDQKCYLV